MTRHFMTLARAVLGLGLMALPGRAVSDFQGSSHLVDIDAGAIQYGKEVSHGPVARLVERLHSGATTLQWDEKLGYLPALLKALDVPPVSQMLVFSKTSLQREHIHPQNPRAIFFNDDVYLGYIPGAPLMEISEVDPRLGGVFYTLDQKRDGPPAFKRVDNCTECHASAKTMGVPGHLVRSFETDANGVVDLASGAEQVDHRTPLAERWGGWFVTGTHGAMAHRGNLMGSAFERAKTEPLLGANKTSLGEYFDTAKYVSAGSDIAALMVFEHQAHMHNFIARLNYMATQHLAAYGHVNYLNSPVEAFLRYLLFVEEFPLSAPVRGDAAFVRAYEAGGVRDRRGRSLRQLDLGRRLYRYPCSPLIHSDAFTRLPAPLKEKLFARLWQILSGTEPASKFPTIRAEDRDAIRDILADTLQGLPTEWTRSDTK
jgi:hypothetical protein